MYMWAKPVNFQLTEIIVLNNLDSKINILMTRLSVLQLVEG